MIPWIWRNVKKCIEAMFEESFSEVRLENMLYCLGPGVNHWWKEALSGGLDDNNVDKKQLIVNLNYLILIAISYGIIMSNCKWGNWGS